MVSEMLKHNAIDLGNSMQDCFHATYNFEDRKNKDLKNVATKKKDKKDGDGYDAMKRANQVKHMPEPWGWWMKTKPD